jgi:hypothetical protein
MADTFASFNAKVARLQKELGDDATLHEIGKMAKVEARRAASADLGGDPKFSGWAPELKTAYDIVGKGKLSFRPGGRAAAGPWTVAEIGRNQGNASGFAGPSINRRTGITSLMKSGAVRRSRGARARRWNGVTRGKGTASTALEAIDKQVPKIVDRRVGRAIRRTF